MGTDVRLIKFSAILLFCMWASTGAAEEIGMKQIRELESQVQEAKQDVLEVSRSLMQLEEQLVYPPKNRILIFLTLAQDKDFPLDAVQIKIDRKENGNRIFEPEELGGLQQGGSQRIYTGNIKPGSHVVELSFIGGGMDSWIKADYEFTKGAGPKIIEVILSGMDSGKKDIRFRD